MVYGIPERSATGFCEPRTAAIAPMLSFGVVAAEIAFLWKAAIRLPGVPFIGNIFVRTDPAWPRHGLRVGVAPALAAGLVTLAAAGPRLFPTPSAKTTEPDDNGRRCRDRRSSARVRRNVSASARHPATASCTGKVVDASS